MQAKTLQTSFDSYSLTIVKIIVLILWYTILFPYTCNIKIQQFPRKILNKAPFTLSLELLRNVIFFVGCFNYILVFNQYDFKRFRHFLR